MTDPLTERQGAAILADPATAELLAYAVEVVETGAADEDALTTPEQVTAWRKRYEAMIADGSFRDIPSAAEQFEQVRRERRDTPPIA